MKIFKKSNHNTVNFGFKKVKKYKKKYMVNKVFNSVAKKYDFMNDIMSFGIHRIWKKIMIFYCNPQYKQKILDIAGGTGDLTKKFSKLVGKNGKVILLDTNYQMINIGRKKLRNAGIIDNVYYIQGNAEQLPFIENYFDCVSISFGLRNITDKKKALNSIFRVLKPGGKLLILEFSKPKSIFLNKIYDFYSFYILPYIGYIITKDFFSYLYLVESIRTYPNLENIKKIMLNIGFEDVKYYLFTGGIVSLHQGFKY